MLQILREKTTGWVAIVILAALAIPFAFVGIESYFHMSVAGHVAKVNGVAISQERFQRRFEEQREQMRAMLGSNFDDTQFNTPEVRRQVLDGMIDEEVMRQAAENNGVIVPAATLQKEIAAIPSFQVDGRFDPARYQAVLANVSLTPRAFEEQRANALLVRTLPLSVGRTAIVSDAYLERYLALRDQSRSFDYLLLPAPTEETIGEIAEADLEAHHQAHQDRYQSPETVMVEYVELNAANLSVDAEPDEETLRQRYEESKTRYVQPESRLVSHILIQTPANADATAQQAAQARAAALVAKAREAGADFAALAREHSEDPGSKGMGGDLGWIERGVTDPAFEDALFTMQVGVSDPVKGSDGWHVLWLREIKQAAGKSFEEARDEVREEYLSGERDRVYNDQATRLSDAIYRDPTTLDSASQELGLSLQKAGPFTRAGGPGLFANPAVQRVLFSESLIEHGQSSDLIEVTPGHGIALRVTEHKPPALRPLSEVREQVLAAVRAERLDAAGKAEAEKVLAEVDSAAALEALAKSRELEVKKATDVGRNSALVDPAINQAAFALPHPQDGKASLGQASLQGGAYAIIALTGVKAGDPAKVEASTRDALRQELLQSMGAAEAGDLVKALRRQAKIEIVESQL